MRISLACLLAIVALVAPSSLAGPQFRSFEAVAVPHRAETKLPPPGRAGDRDLLTWTIHDRHGRPFGVASLDCNWFRGRGRQCVGVFRLARGSFAVSGVGQTRASGEFVVTGGTGAYTTSHGYLAYNAISRGRIVLTGALS